MTRARPPSPRPADSPGALGRGGRVTDAVSRYRAAASAPAARERGGGVGEARGDGGVACRGGRSLRGEGGGVGAAARARCSGGGAARCACCCSPLAVCSSTNCNALRSTRKSHAVSAGGGGGSPGGESSSTGPSCTPCEWAELKSPAAAGSSSAGCLSVAICRASLCWVVPRSWLPVCSAACSAAARRLRKRQ